MTTKAELRRIIALQDLHLADLTARYRELLGAVEKPLPDHAKHSIALNRIHRAQATIGLSVPAMDIPYADPVDEVSHGR